MVSLAEEHVSLFIDFKRVERGSVEWINHYIDCTFTRDVDTVKSGQKFAIITVDSRNFAAYVWTRLIYYHRDRATGVYHIPVKILESQIKMIKDSYFEQVKTFDLGVIERVYLTLCKPN